MPSKPTWSNGQPFDHVGFFCARGAVGECLVMSHDVLDLDLRGSRVRAEMDRLHPESCRVCHYNHSTQSHQFQDPEHAGPCDFGPGNPSLLTHWAPVYAAQHGYWPFAN